MPEIGKGKNTEQAIPTVDTINQNIVDFAAKEEAEADRIFYESQGLQPDGKTPLDEDPAEDPPAKKEEAEPNKEEEEKVGLPNKAEVKPNKEEDLTKDLTVENADKRITSAQKKMHDSNKRAKDAETNASNLATENADLRKLIDEKATTADAGDPVTKQAELPNQTEEEVDADLENLRKEYPEIAEPMIKMMQKQKASNDVLQDRLDKQEEREKQRDIDAKVTEDNAHYKEISDIHPDFEELSQEPLLDDWIEGLPAMERMGATAIRKDGTTKDVIELLTSFKKANGYKLPAENGTKETTKANSKLEKAKSLSTPQFKKAKETNLEDNKIRFTRQQIAKMTDAEWKENEPAIDEAMALGLVR
jgi:hypothetical protein